MKNNYTCVLTTTINVPIFLENICRNINRFKHKNVFILVIGDKKTPKKANSYCNRVSKKFKVDIKYLDVEKQLSYFKRYPKILKLFPFNDALRRILGSLIIFKDKRNFQRLIFVDDDNFVSDSIDFIGSHEIVGSNIKAKSIYSKNKFPNLYKFIEADVKLPLFPRGYPWSKRSIESFKLMNSRESKSKKVLANCGYILGDPDIDATSRIFWKINIKKINHKKFHFLKDNNFFPFNDQNTAISRELFKLYFKPLSAGRNSDIWTSYALTKLAHIHKNLISYGQPHLKQIRNIHDNWKDFELEKIHNISTDLFLEILISIKINKKDSKFNTFKFLIDKCLIKTNLLLKSTKKTLNNKSSRHYQALNAAEKNKREFTSLTYIKKYFLEYKNWLKLVENF